MEVVFRAFQFSFLAISLAIGTAGVLVLLGKRIRGMPRLGKDLDRGTAPTGAAQFISNHRTLGCAWIFIGLFGLLMGVTSMAVR